MLYDNVHAVIAAKNLHIDPTVRCLLEKDIRTNPLSSLWEPNQGGLAIWEPGPGAMSLPRSSICNIIYTGALYIKFTPDYFRKEERKRENQSRRRDFTIIS
jgi:hypothetical protein